MGPTAAIPRLAARLLAGLAIVVAAACNVVVGLDKLDFKDQVCAQPCDDLNPCTQDDCDVAGVCKGQPIPEHGACAGGVAGVCVNGKCAMACAFDAACDDENPCTIDSCDATTLMCVHAPVTGSPLPPLPQKQGDCHQSTCVFGAVTSSVDDADLPDLSNTCVSHFCNDGVATTPPVQPGTPCGDNKQCDGSGSCGCNVDTDCTAPDTCGGGDPGVAGSCGCTVKTCATLGVTCGNGVSDGCHTLLNCNGTLDPTETDLDCGGPTAACATRCELGKRCADDTDCASAHCVDGVCCNSTCTHVCQACNLGFKAGLCSGIAANTPDPPPDGDCTGKLVCDGQGQCKRKAGVACNASNQCVNFCKAGVCH